jgi:hypothetical protein
MRPNCLGHLTRWATGALMLLLVHSLGMARPARAGCNHLVSSQSDRLLSMNQLDGLITGGSPSSLSDEPAGQPGPKHPTPCSGPGCSRRVPVPVPTTLHNSDRFDHWGVLNSLEILPVASPPGRTLDEPAAQPTGEPPSIFHPPPA